MSVVQLVKEAAPHLKDGGGTIVTITSRSVKEANQLACTFELGLHEQYWA